MGALGTAGNGGLWGMGPFHDNLRRRSNKKRDTSKRELRPSNSADSTAAGYSFPFKQSATSAALCLTGDTIAQLRHRWVKNKGFLYHSQDIKDNISTLLSEHDYIRALRDDFIWISAIWSGFICMVPIP